MILVAVSTNFHGVITPNFGIIEIGNSRSDVEYR
jgi:hypothetical protein